MGESFGLGVCSRAAPGGTAAEARAARVEARAEARVEARAERAEARVEARAEMCEATAPPAGAATRAAPRAARRGRGAPRRPRSAAAGPWALWKGLEKRRARRSAAQPPAAAQRSSALEPAFLVAVALGAPMPEGVRCAARLRDGAWATTDWRSETRRGGSGVEARRKWARKPRKPRKPRRRAPALSAARNARGPIENRTRVRRMRVRHFYQ